MKLRKPIGWLASLVLALLAFGAQALTLSPTTLTLSPGQTGHTTVRLTLDASGRVTRVGFVSGSLMMPSLKTELERSGRDHWLAEEMASLTDPATYITEPESAWSANARSRADWNRSSLRFSRQWKTRRSSAGVLKT